MGLNLIVFGDGIWQWFGFVESIGAELFYCVGKRVGFEHCDVWGVGGDVVAAQTQANMVQPIMVDTR